MKKILYLSALIIALTVMSCKHNDIKSAEELKQPSDAAIQLSDSQVEYKHVGDIPLPLAHIKRDSVKPGSFAEYLRNLSLHPANYPTHLYNGSEKTNQGAKFRVIDIDIDPIDLQQCADACIRLYAEWLWQNGQYDKIKFHFVNGFLADYGRWAHGERIQVNSAQTHAAWYRINHNEDYSHSTFRQYLRMVFTYAGTASLPKDMAKRTNPYDVQIGDVIIQPGSPGHAVMVVDKADRYLLLAQSYMPAQEIELLRRHDRCSEVWNSINGGEGEEHHTLMLYTPEWNFRLDNHTAFVMYFKNQ